MTIYRVIEHKSCKLKEMFFQTEELARRYMKSQAEYYLNDPMNDGRSLFISLETPRYLSIRFGGINSDNTGLYSMFEIDEIVVY